MTIIIISHRKEQDILYNHKEARKNNQKKSFSFSGYFIKNANVHDCLIVLCLIHFRWSVKPNTGT